MGKCYSWPEKIKDDRLLYNSRPALIYHSSQQNSQYVSSDCLSWVKTFIEQVKKKPHYLYNRIAVSMSLENLKMTKKIELGFSQGIESVKIMVVAELEHRLLARDVKPNDIANALIYQSSQQGSQPKSLSCLSWVETISLPWKEFIPSLKLFFKLNKRVVGLTSPEDLEQQKILFSDINRCN